MNTTLSTPVDEQNHTHPPQPAGHGSSARHVSFADRVALHLGLALITWSRRSRSVNRTPAVDDRHLRNERARERAAREILWTQSVYLGQPRR